MAVSTRGFRGKFHGSTSASQEAAQFLPKGCSRKMPPSFLNLNGVVCSNTLFSNTSALTSSLLFRGNSTCKILEHLVWSNTSGFQFWGLLLEQTFCRHCAAFPARRAETNHQAHIKSILVDCPSVFGALHQLSFDFGKSWSVVSSVRQI